LVNNSAIEKRKKPLSLCALIFWLFRKIAVLLQADYYQELCKDLILNRLTFHVSGMEV